MAGISDILGALQQGVSAIRDLSGTISTVFPRSGTVVSSAIATTGSTITFTSSQAAGFMAVTTSSGGAYYISLYR